jgi:hypothetical protein
MRRPPILLTLAAITILALVGCATKENGPVTAVTSLDPSPTASASTTASPSPSKTSPAPATSSTTSDPYTLSVEGIGPYRFDASPTVAGLDAANKITGITHGNEVCPANWFANGAGLYTDVQLLFTPDEKLDLILARGSKIHTPSGAKIGNDLATLQHIYGSRGETLTNGAAKAYIVITSTGKALYFELDNGKVFVIIAGNGERLKQRFLNGSDC